MIFANRNLSEHNGKFSFLITRIFSEYNYLVGVGKYVQFSLIASKI